MSQANTFDEIVYLTREPLELYKVLKIIGVPTGGEAKVLIAEGYVAHNARIETRKRKKVYAGDTVQLEDTLVLIQLAEGAVSRAAPAAETKTQGEESSPPPDKAAPHSRKKRARPRLG